MRKTSKKFRFLTVFALVFAMMVTFCIPASAAGVETWYGSYVVEPAMYFTGANYTPTKTMGVSGTLYVTADFYLTDTNIYSGPAICFLEILDTNGNILVSDSGTTTSTIVLGVSLPVTVGQKICICTAMYDTSTGNPRSAQVQYDHFIS